LLGECSHAGREGGTAVPVLGERQLHGWVLGERQLHGWVLGERQVHGWVPSHAWSPRGRPTAACQTVSQLPLTNLD
jgi:hypothetical protein